MLAKQLGEELKLIFLRAAVNAKGSGISNFLLEILFKERNKQWNKNLHFSDCDVPAFLIFQLQVEKLEQVLVKHLLGL